MDAGAIIRPHGKSQNRQGRSFEEAGYEQGFEGRMWKRRWAMWAAPGTTGLPWDPGLGGRQRLPIRGDGTSTEGKRGSQLASLPFSRSQGSAVSLPGPTAPPRARGAGGPLTRAAGPSPNTNQASPVRAERSLSWVFCHLQPKKPENQHLLLFYGCCFKTF